MAELVCSHYEKLDTQAQSSSLEYSPMEYQADNDQSNRYVYNSRSSGVSFEESRQHECAAKNEFHYDQADCDDDCLSFKPKKSSNSDRNIAESFNHRNRN